MAASRSPERPAGAATQKLSWYNFSAKRKLKKENKKKLHRLIQDAITNYDARYPKLYKFNADCTLYDKLKNANALKVIGAEGFSEDFVLAESDFSDYMKQEWLMQVRLSLFASASLL